MGSKSFSNFVSIVLVFDWHISSNTTHGLRLLTVSQRTQTYSLAMLSIINRPCPWYKKGGTVVRIPYQNNQSSEDQRSLSLRLSLTEFVSLPKQPSISPYRYLDYRE